MTKMTGLATSVALGLASAAGLTGTAWAGADDGGTKAFYDVPGPGAYVLGSPASAPQPAAPAWQGNGYSATVNGNLYDSYRAMTYHHRDRYRIPGR
jgi:hypothetical protein